MITVKVTGDKKVIAMLKGAEKKIPNVLYKKMRDITLMLQSYVQKRKLSGQVLRVRTGRLRSSITSRVEKQDKEIIGRIGTNVIYGRLWEKGGTIPAHEIRPKRAQALHFYTKGGGEVFCKVVHQPARTVKARPFLRPALEENRQRILGMLGNIATEIQ